MRGHLKKLGIESLYLTLATALVLIAVASIAVPLLPRTSAATQSVNINNSAFTPSSITIAPGDSVTWTNSDSLTHTVTGSGWGSGTLANGATYTHQFNTTGTFAYHCSIHSFMTGTVIVSSGTVTPPPTTTPSKPFLSGMTLIAVIVVVVIIVVVALAVVLMRRKPAKKT
jgi:plastocyanin